MTFRELGPTETQAKSRRWRQWQVPRPLSRRYYLLQYLPSRLSYPWEGAGLGEGGLRCRRASRDSARTPLCLCQRHSEWSCSVSGRRGRGLYLHVQASRGGRGLRCLLRVRAREGCEQRSISSITIVFGVSQSRGARTEMYRAHLSVFCFAVDGMQSVVLSCRCGGRGWIG